MSEEPQSQWKPLPRLRTHEQVMAEIESRLIAGTLKAGDRLPPERQFAEALGVSRGAVREALRILEAIGVVEAGTGSGPTSGSMIVKDSIAGMAMVMRIHLQLASFTQEDLVEVRLQMEGLAARKAAKSATSEDIADLRELVEQMRGVHTTASFNDLDTAFHVRIARASDNGLAAVLMAALREALRQAMVTAFEGLKDPVRTMESVADEHAAIVDAIASGDADLAVERVTTHIRDFYRAVGFSEMKWAG
ncbi:FadR/GntR family transcriptional regulator [Mycolicibacterium austroafricanum]|uniref:FadR/GntR family transcriptional regulator n=1 Tax=Mycolicibacterium austroafricanum TaxID=39687 RepID=A0ABT8H8R0_MYCAO|nr:FadR/GntR family transcriptional regulator [Mycolicibacterium austroafricanum]MDN4517152.1 FadR/GntR family transcriptional regulator [Mycolicibacterium austroafricanum]